jgi:hypothetical protein
MLAIMPIKVKHFINYCKVSNFTKKAIGFFDFRLFLEKIFHAKNGINFVTT